MKLQLTSVIWQEDDWFVAECVDLGVTSQGRSEPEALRNLEEAVLLYLQDDDTGEIKVPPELRKIKPLVVSA
jgi:predicted RNase H-like HicB family nuclease